MLNALDAAAVRRWCGGGLAALRVHQYEIDELNVFPVPDGDTGTNLVLTLTSAQQALALDLDNSPESDQTPLGHALRLMARGALLGARGNSGVIVSQILRGLADAMAGTGAVHGKELAVALRSAVAAAYAAVAEPVEGTVLSVIAAAAEGAALAGSDDVVVVARAAASSAARALARTPQQLPALAAAGVVDAGGQGLCLLLDALVEALSGGSAGSVRQPPAVIVPFSPRVGTDSPVREAGSSAYGYEVQYLLDADPAAVDVLKRRLAPLGDSLVVVGTGDGHPPTWNVHVHVNDVGAAIEAGVVAGRPHRITVTRFADQVAGPTGPATGGRATDPHSRAAVVMAAGDGLAGLFAAEGATVVGGNPSTAEVVEGIRATGAGLVVLLPNDTNTHAVAATAAREACATGVRVSVVPTRSPVQALAALAVRDTGRAFSDDVISMAEAAGACRYGEVCYARREALTVAGRCRPGDVLGLVDGEVHLIGGDLVQLSCELLDRMLGGGGELVTLLVGAGAPAGLGDALRSHVAQAWPFVEVHAYDGGQPFYPLLLGVE